MAYSNIFSNYLTLYFILKQVKVGKVQKEGTPNQNKSNTKQRERQDIKM
jgi:hypothetical protein